MSTSPALAALPKGSLVLVSGANGFIASHIIDHLLQHGFAVRGTVRTQDKADLTTEVYKRLHPSGQYEAVVVPDMGSPDAYDQTLGGVAGVVHVASDLSFGSNPHKVITPVVVATKGILAAANRAGVKRFVLTSSSAAMVMPQHDVEYSIDRSSFNDAASAEAWKEPVVEDDPVKGYWVYSASKAEGERAAWDFVAREKPSFVLNTVNPNYNIGPVLDKRLNMSTGGLFYKLIKDPTDEQALTRLRTFPPQFFVDVQDVAKLHLAALAETDIQGERLLGFAAPFNFNTVVAMGRKLIPDGKWPADEPHVKHDLLKVDTSRSAEVLRRFGQDGLTQPIDSFRKAIEAVKNE